MSATRHLKIGTWCVYFDVFLLVARVGGAWANTTRAGLWYWTCHDDSSIVWDDIGARLLNLIRDLMCRLLRLYALRSCRRWLDSYH